MVFRMEVGVHQDRGLTEHLESTDVQTDVEVEREDLGLMTSTEFLVRGRHLIFATVVEKIFIKVNSLTCHLKRKYF